ncbi:MAG: hypothetical protein Q4E17_01795 [Synergistes sp.]|nr:hypothetical protein [Synergistes sp.]
MMNNKIGRLQRWLDRLGKACESKNWKSAVAEADCLSAELRQVREELWEEAEAKTVGVPLALRVRKMCAFGTKAAAIALIIVCSCAFPIAVENMNGGAVASLPVESVEKEAKNELAIVTTEEKELIQLLRKNLAETKTSLKKAEAQLNSKKNDKKTKVTAKAAEIAPKQITAPTMQINAEHSVKADDLLTLIQIGEKSLRGGESVIKMIN